MGLELIGSIGFWVLIGWLFCQYSIRYFDYRYVTTKRMKWNMGPNGPIYVALIVILYGIKAAVGYFVWNTPDPLFPGVPGGFDTWPYTLLLICIGIVLLTVYHMLFHFYRQYVFGFVVMLVILLLSAVSLYLCIFHVHSTLGWILTIVAILLEFYIAALSYDEWRHSGASGTMVSKCAFGDKTGRITGKGVKQGGVGDLLSTNMNNNIHSGTTADFYQSIKDHISV